MSELLIKQIRKARELKSEVGKFVFTVRRPTDAEAMYEIPKLSDFQFAVRFTDGWANVTEADVVPSGGPDAVPFDRALCMEWFADHPEFWEPIGQRALDGYKQHRKKLADAGNGSSPG